MSDRDYRPINSSAARVIVTRIVLAITLLVALGYAADSRSEGSASRAPFLFRYLSTLLPACGTRSPVPGATLVCINPVCHSVVPVSGVEVEAECPCLSSPYGGVYLTGACVRRVDPAVEHGSVRGVLPGFVVGASSALAGAYGPHGGQKLHWGRFGRLRGWRGGVCLGD